MADRVSRKKLLRAIMEADFVLKELNLFLDTHPCHKAALSKFYKYQQKSAMLKSEYEKLFGPLTPSVTDCADVWEWNNSPWPWENC